MQKRVLYLWLLVHGLQLLPAFPIGLSMKHKLSTEQNIPSSLKVTQHTCQHLQHCNIASVQQQPTTLQNTVRQPFGKSSRNTNMFAFQELMCLSFFTHTQLYTYWHQASVPWNAGRHHCSVSCTLTKFLTNIKLGGAAKAILLQRMSSI